MRVPWIARGLTLLGVFGLVALVSAPVGAFTITQTCASCSGGSPGGLPVYSVTALVAGDTFSLDWSYDRGTASTADDILASATFTVVSISGTDLILDITVANESNDDTARLTVLGLDTTPDATGGSIADTCTGLCVDDDALTLVSTSNFPGFSTVNVCATAQSCSSGANGGLSPGQHDAFRFDLTRATDWPDTIDLSAFAIKIQAEAASFELPGTPQGGGGGTTEVPAPPALLLLSSGLVALGLGAPRRS